MRVGETLGGLLNASFGNATELITAIIALAKGQVNISPVLKLASKLMLVIDYNCSNITRWFHAFQLAPSHG